MHDVTISYTLYHISYTVCVLRGGGSGNEGVQGRPSARWSYLGDVNSEGVLWRVLVALHGEQLRLRLRVLQVLWVRGVHVPLPLQGLVLVLVLVLVLLMLPGQ